MPGAAIWYRRRTRNTDRKVGNLAQWLANWGGAHDAMLILDADSLMSAGAIRTLAARASSSPRLPPAQTGPTA